MISSILCRSRAWAVVALFASGAALGAEQVPAEVRTRVKDALQQYQVGHFEESLRLFSEAYELKPLPGILFNLAQCHRQLGNYERAEFFYQRYLALSTTKPKNAAEVKDLIREVEQKQADLEKKRQDAELAERQKRELELARLGSTEAPAPGFTPLPLPPMTNAGGDSPRQTALAPTMAPPSSAQAAVQPAGEAQARVEPDSSVLHRWWFWTGIGVLAAGAIVTTYVVTAPQPTPGSLPNLSAR